MTYFWIVIETIAQIAELLKAHGAWGLVSLQGLVIWRLVLHIQALQNQHQDTVQKLLLDHNKQQREETTQIVTVMTMTEQSLKSMNETLNALILRWRG